MATPVVAATTAAVGFYLYLRRTQQCGFAGVLDPALPSETHLRTEQAPTTWAETLYLFKEAVRCVAYTDDSPSLHTRMKCRAYMHHTAHASVCKSIMQCRHNSKGVHS